MKGICSYCKEETEVEYFKHPVTYQRESTCGACQTKLLNTKTYFRERKMLANIGCFMPVLILGSVLSIIFFNKLLGILGVIIFTSLGIISTITLDYLVKKRGKNFGLYAKNLPWCETCKYYLKVKNWEIEGCRENEMQSVSEIPCSLINETKQVWINYFNTDREQRALYPKNCERWTRRKIRLIY